MATRSNIIIKQGRNKIYLYRHWDGYPSETGRDLLTRLLESRRHDEGQAFLSNLIRANREDWEGKPLYELTDQIHGDIEYLYQFEFGAMEWGKSGLKKVKAYKVNLDGKKKLICETPKFVDAIDHYNEFIKGEFKKDNPHKFNIDSRRVS